MLVKMEGFGGGSGGTVIYFGCKDCAIEASRKVINGGAVVKEKMSIGEHGFIALARDTEGNMIGFYSM
jgi:predicted enzyme related to lactoylglutathione lyase